VKQYDSTIRELEAKLKGFGTENGKSGSKDVTQSKNEELEEINSNLNAQISEYNKLIKRLYDEPTKVKMFFFERELMIQ